MPPPQSSDPRRRPAGDVSRKAETRSSLSHGPVSSDLHPEHWSRLWRVDPSRLDVSGARDRTLQRLTTPFAALILVVYYAAGFLLALVGLDVASLTGLNAFGILLVEAAFNGVAVMILSAPLGFFALSTPKARDCRSKVVNWIISRELSDARRYLEAVEGERGLIWRFTRDDSPKKSGDPIKAPHFLVARRLRDWSESPIETMLNASRNGTVEEIDLDLYRDAVRALQEIAVQRREGDWAVHAGAVPAEAVQAESNGLECQAEEA